MAASELEIISLLTPKIEQATEELIRDMVPRPSHFAESNFAGYLSEAIAEAIMKETLGNNFGFRRTQRSFA